MVMINIALTTQLVVFPFMQRCVRVNNGTNKHNNREKDCFFSFSDWKADSRQVEQGLENKANGQ